MKFHPFCPLWKNLLAPSGKLHCWPYPLEKILPTPMVLKLGLCWFSARC